MKRLAFLSFLFSLLCPSLALAAPSPGIPVGGLVLDSDGKPVQGASVRLVPRARWHETWTMHLEGRANPEPVAKAVSDAGGQFRVLAPQTGMWRVIVEAPGRVPQQYDLEPLLEAADLPPVRLPADAGLEVRVADPKGQPVAGAQVRVTTPGHRVRGHRRSDAFPETWGAVTRTAVTGADGRAVLPGAKDERLTVSALAPGHPLVTSSEASGSVKLALQAGCERVLEVVDAQSRPVVGAVAQVSDRIVALSGETGRLRVAVPCGNEAAQILVRTRDGRLATVSLSPPAPGKEPAGPLRVALGAPPPPLTGRVVDAVSREPVAGAFVWGEDAAAFARTDARGSYTVGSSEWLQAASPEHMPAFEEVQAAPGGQPAGPAFALTPAARVDGAVVDAEGRPLAGAVVQVLPRPGGRLSMARLRDAARPALTDARGLFHLRIASRMLHEIRAEHEGFAPASVKVPEIEPRKARKDVRIVLERGRTGFGRVVDTRDKPVAGARVTLRPVVQEDESGIMVMGSFETGADFEGTTDATGRFEIGRLPAGRFDLTARARGFAPMSVRAVAVQGKAAARVDLGTVVLPPGLTVEGTVVDPQGRAIEGASISAMPTDFLSAWAFSSLLAGSEEPLETGPDGRFTLQGLREGMRIDLHAWKEGYVQGSAEGVDVPAPGPVRIVLDPGVRIAGRVVSEEGRPIAGALVSASRVEGGPGIMGMRSGVERTNDEGRFELTGIEPGKLLLQASAQGYLAGEARVDAVAGTPPEEVRIVLRTGAVVTGRVLGPDDAPVAGAEVRVVQTSGESARFSFGEGSVRTDGEGVYRLSGIAEGRRSIAAAHQDYQRAVRELEVRAGENRLDLRLGRGFPLSGRVVDPAGGPVADARVYLEIPGLGFDSDDSRVAASGADGSFQFPSVASGTYTLRAAKEGYAPASLPEPVQVAVAPVAGLELQLSTGGTIRGRIKGLGFEELSGVRVFAIRADALGLGGGGPSSGVVDFEGAYSISGVAPGEWMVMAMSGRGMARGQVTLPEGTPEVTLDLELGGGFTLSGRVLRSGAPMPGLQVMASGEDVMSHAMGSTGPQGEFRLEGLEAGKFTVVAMDFRKGLRHSEEIEISGDREIVIELPVQRLSGRVLDATDSSPLEGATVVLEKPDGDDGMMGGYGSPNASTDSSGAFTISGVPEGTWRAVARKEGYAPAEVAVEVRPGADVGGVRISLSPGAGLVLEVRTYLGSIPAQISAALVDAEGRTILAAPYETGEGGRVRIGSAPPGRFRLYVSGGGAATASLDVTVPGPPVQVVLLPGSQLAVNVPALTAQGGRGTVTVTDVNGQPFRSVLYGIVLTEWPLVEGNTVVDGVPPGTWRVRVTAADGRTWEGTVNTVGGRTPVVLE